MLLETDHKKRKGHNHQYTEYPRGSGLSSLILFDAQKGEDIYQET